MQVKKRDILAEMEKLRGNQDYCIELCDAIFNMPQAECIEILGELVDFARNSRLDFAYPWFLYKMGCSFYSCSEIERAIDLLEEACRIFESEDDARGMLNASVALISVYSCCFNFEKAIETSIRSMELAAEINDYEALSVLKADIVAMYIDMEDYEQARYLSQEIERMSYIGSISNDFIINLNRAICEMKLGDMSEAQKYLERAEVLLSERNISLRYMLLQEKANLMKLRGLYQEAGFTYEESAYLAEKYGFTSGLAEVLLDWMDMDMMRGRHESAVKKADQVMSIIEDDCNCRLKRKLYSKMSALFKARGDSEMALFYLEKYMETEKMISEALKSPSMKELEIKRASDRASTYMAISRQKDRIYESLGRIMSNLNEDGIFAVIAEEIQDICSPDIIQIVSYDESVADYEYKISVEKGRRLKVDNLPVESNTFSGYCIRNDREIFIRDMENEHSRYIKDFGEYIEDVRKLQTGVETEVSVDIPNSAIFVPVRFHGKVTGVISIQSFSKDAFSLEDLSTLRVLAEYSGIALNNALSYKKLEHSANHDFLTSLLTRSSILKTGKEMYECQERKRSDDGMCILLIDIDDFKLVNDSHGHTVGDIVLRKVADIIRYSVRSDDKAGRYGGEEFIVLMNDARREVALEAAERIRRNIEDDSMTIVKPGVELSVTVSIGVSGTRSGEKTVDQLIEEADEALYRAKAEGKNRVSEYYNYNE